MTEGKLVIGTRRYSSWSLRGWLAVRLAGLDVEEVVIKLAGGNTPAVKAASPSGFVPYLEHRGARVWESLAIGAYCAEIAPTLWPEERLARAAAWSIATEMHNGFAGLRRAMPMVLGASFPGRGRTPEALADIERIVHVWLETRRRFGAGGPFLFGSRFTVADAMYAPVCVRFLCFKPEIPSLAWKYCEAVRVHPLVEEWWQAAAEEPLSWRLPQLENPA